MLPGGSKEMNERIKQLAEQAEELRAILRKASEK